MSLVERVSEGIYSVNVSLSGLNSEETEGIKLHSTVSDTLPLFTCS